MNPVAIGDIINGLCRSWGIERKLKEQAAISQWPCVVGERIAKETQPLGIRDGILFLYVEKAVWRNELTFMKRELIQKLNRAVGASLIRDIVFSTKKGANYER
jgi:predicted nucleic acid-binding Zn ribbon protein